MGSRLGPGKKERLWRRVRHAWIKANPPDHHGGYLCGLCGLWVHKSEMELDHIVTRAREPQSFADPDNLQPTHSRCNQQKGGRSVEPKVTPAEYELRRLLDL